MFHCIASSRQLELRTQAEGFRPTPCAGPGHTCLETPGCLSTELPVVLGLARASARSSRDRFGRSMVGASSPATIKAQMAVTRCITLSEHLTSTGTRQHGTEGYTRDGHRSSRCRLNQSSKARLDEPIHEVWRV